MSAEWGQTNLAVIDPGLLEPAGHHAGFASVLAASYPRYRTGFDVTVLANRKLDNRLMETLESAGVKAVPCFDVAFYRYFEQAGNVALRSEYILALSKGYLEAFVYLRRKWGENGTGVLLYHTLSWEHAAALLLAIRQFGEMGRLFRHEVYLMFAPGVDRQGVMYDTERALNYRVAFSGLSELSNVRLSASCWDYAGAYRYLLDREEDLTIHPCFLADWSALSRPGTESWSVDLDTACVLLYLGDAKAEKGFLSLPKLIREWQALLGEKAKMIIHYTSHWGDASIEAVIERLRAMSLQDQRIELVNTFLEDAELHRLIKRCDLAVVSYDDVIYQYKTSGVLWLFAYYRVAMVVYSLGWLFREVTRLGMKVILKQSHSALTDRVDQRCLVFEDVSHLVSVPGSYPEALFRSFWSDLVLLGSEGGK